MNDPRIAELAQQIEDALHEGDEGLAEELNAELEELCFEDEMQFMQRSAGAY